MKAACAAAGAAGALGLCTTPRHPPPITRIDAPELVRFAWLCNSGRAAAAALALRGKFADARRSQLIVPLVHREQPRSAPAATQSLRNTYVLVGEVLV